jgi:hypothetical protein
VRAAQVECTCSPETARARLARRVARGTGPSDAGPELYDWSAARFEPLRPAPGVARHVAHTDARGWRAALRRFARELVAPATAAGADPESRTAEDAVPCRCDPSGP